MNPRSKSERPLKARLREAARGEILTAAERVVAAHGAQHARMEEVALAAGVSVGTLYNHFSDKGSLIAALLDERRAELIARLDRALEDRKDDPFPTQLEAFITATAEHFAEHRQLFNVVFTEEAETGAKPRVHGSPSLKLIRARAKTIIDRGLQLKALRTEDETLYPALLMGMVRAALAKAVQDESSELDARKLAAAISRMFLQGAGRK